MKEKTAKSNWQYFEAQEVSAGSRVRLSSIADFERYAALHQVRAILLLQAGEAGADPFGSCFALMHNGVLVQQASHGYHRLEDYHAALSAGFPDAATYYDARVRGIERYADYELALAAQLGDLSVLAELHEAGFVTGYEHWKAGDWKEVWPDWAVISNAHELYLAAKEKGFPDYPRLEYALASGFVDYDECKAAATRGFSDAATYRDALSRGFANYDDYQFSEKHGIRDAQDAKTYFSLLSMAGGRDLPSDQKVLLSLLSMLEEGKRISVNKLDELFRKTLIDYQQADTASLPAWFTSSLHTRQELVSFLGNHELVKEYGRYDDDGEFFQVARLQDRHVVIDGANVAHNNRGKGEQPQAAQIRKLADFLRSKGFEQISVIADAALKHRLADLEEMEQLRDELSYIEAPANKSADQFIIQYVKLKNCLLVSNDTFREWKVKDEWVARHIDYYRLSFMIKDDLVLMPDLDG